MGLPVQSTWWGWRGDGVVVVAGVVVASCWAAISACGVCAEIGRNDDKV